VWQVEEIERGLIRFGTSEEGTKQLEQLRRWNQGTLALGSRERNCRVRHAQYENGLLQGFGHKRINTLERKTRGKGGLPEEGKTRIILLECNPLGKTEEQRFQVESRKLGGTKWGNI